MPLALHRRGGHRNDRQLGGSSAHSPPLAAEFAPHAGVHQERQRQGEEEGLEEAHHYHLIYHRAVGFLAVRCSVVDALRGANEVGNGVDGGIDDQREDLHQRGLVRGREAAPRAEQTARKVGYDEAQ